MHPIYFSTIVFGLVWTFFALLFLPFALSELRGNPWITLYFVLPLIGLALVVGPVAACSLRIDAAGIHTARSNAFIRQASPTPALIAWDTITSVTVSVDSSNFAILDLPVLDSVGSARRLEPVLTYDLDAGISRTVHLWQLGGRISPRGLAQVIESVDQLRGRSGLSASPHPSIGEVRAQLKAAGGNQDPPPDYKPRRAQ